MKRIIQLFCSSNEADRQIGLELFIKKASYTRYLDIVNQYKRFNSYYLGNYVENLYRPVWGALLQLSYEQFQRLESRFKNKKMTNYTRTNHRNIYKMGSTYRVRKCLNGKKMTANFKTIKDCKRWLHMLEN